MNESDAEDPPGGGMWRRRGVLGAIGTLAAASGAADAQDARLRPAGEAGNPAAFPDAGNLAFQRAGRGAVRRSLAARLDDLPLNPEDFGATGDEHGDDGPAFIATIAEAARRHNATIALSGGRTYEIGGTLEIPQGIGIAGPGSQGSGVGFGCGVRHHGNGDLFVWNGSGRAYAGTGGGLRDLLIVKADTFHGGTAIRIVATDDNHRPGEMVLSNILVYGSGSTPGEGGRGGLWAHGLVIDGTASDSPGGRGVRSVHMFKTRFAEATTANETVLLNQVTHFFSYGLQIDGGDTRTQQGVTLKGINENVNFIACDISGNFLIVANDAQNATTDLTISGKLGGAFTNNDSQATGNVALSMSQTGALVLINKSPHLSMRTNLNPRFQLSLSAPTANDKTGDGTIHNVAFDTESYDQGNNIAVPVTSYTCACAGPHRFHAQILLANLGRGHSRADLSVTRTGSATTSITKVVPLSDAAGGFCTVEVGAEFILAYNDRVSVQLVVSGGARTVGVHGGRGTIYTLFEGEYVG